MTGQGIISPLWSSVKLYVIKTFWPLYVIRHSRHRTAFSNCTAALWRLKSKKGIHFRATWEFFTVLIGVLKVWEIEQNKGITIPVHNVCKIIMELSPKNARIDSCPPRFSFIAAMNINKSQENYCYTVSQWFSYLAGPAVTYTNSFIYVVYGWKY